MPDNEPDELQDAESIHFVGTPTKEPEVDFNQPLWLVEIDYSSNVTHHVVNAPEGTQAVRAAILKAMREGENVFAAEGIRIAHMESLG